MALGEAGIYYWYVLSNDYVLILGDVRIVNIILKQVIQDMLVELYLYLNKSL